MLKGLGVGVRMLVRRVDEVIVGRVIEVEVVIRVWKLFG